MYDEDCSRNITICVLLSLKKHNNYLITFCVDIKGGQFSDKKSYRSYMYVWQCKHTFIFKFIGLLLFNK